MKIPHVRKCVKNRMGEVFRSWVIAGVTPDDNIVYIVGDVTQPVDDLALERACSIINEFGIPDSEKRYNIP